MTTNFFQNIASLNLPGTWKLIIQTDAEGHMTVSELFNAACGDKAVKLIVPLNLNGTAQDMDEGFFDKITEPVQKSAELQTNMEAHLKSVEVAKNASKMIQDAKAKTTVALKKDADQELPDPKEEKKKAYDHAMKQIAELNDLCKYEEALNLLPSATDYPEKENELKNKKADLLRKKDLMSQAVLKFNA
jgi:PRTRC genetic system protein E